MNQEISATTIELAGELLKGDFDVEQINRILVEVTQNFENSADYISKVITQRIEK
ncbi:MAG: hypothetical protein JKY88_05345 [Pseudomonadales bacterium]|nr:hypothetical protein [Pseudomonadales bacterium]